ncbi:hypothetical protein [Cryptosporangium arvum]|uniref:hypothetical protein n=1 Tax=Cryptosporangium arvum TaxID=80871 RepID=UPI0004B05C18|nr:hypothetical protein [Cryptosporangium arvum]
MPAAVPAAVPAATAVGPGAARRGAEAVEPPARSGSQSFWSLAVAFPAALSLLRLWIEAGGQFQTTLLLVQNVNPVNLFATTFLVSMRLVTGVLVLAFALGGVLSRAPGFEQRWLARWTSRTPPWLLAAVFGLALATWQILYLPLLIPAFVLVAQATREWRAARPRHRLAVLGVVLAAYAAVIWPTLVDAHAQRAHLALAMFAVPPALALGVGGRVPRWFALPLAVVGPVAVLAFSVAAAATSMTMPVLPLTVTTLTGPDGESTSIRGYVVASDDELTAILSESGGVRYVHNDAVATRVLCPATPDVPVYRLRVHDLHIEDSLLEAWGRRVRPAPLVDATCRIRTSPRSAGAS